MRASPETAQIPERVLGTVEPGGIAQLDNLLSLLNVYYWYNCDQILPQDCLPEVIRDLPDAQLPDVISVLHDNFPICNDQACTEDANTCFQWVCDNWFTQFPNRNTDTRLIIQEWVDSILFQEGTDAESSEAGSPLQRAYNDFTVRKLAEHGATDLEIGNALQVLHIEEERRDLVQLDLRVGYTEFRKAGGTHETFMTEVFLGYFVRECFMLIPINYTDLPDDVLSWSDQQKIPVAQRYIEENADYYELLDTTYQFAVHGVIPPYIHRFSRLADEDG